MLDVTVDPPAFVTRPGVGPVDALLARLLATVAIAVADGRWKRMRHVASPVADGRTTTCGNRAKARAFRERHK